MRQNLLVFILLCFALPFFLGYTAPKKKDKTKADYYVEKIDKKFDRGATNFLVGWTEIFRQPVVYYKNEEKGNRTLKAFKGFGIGLFNAGADTVGGFLNAATAPLPQFEIPLPQNGIQGKTITGGEPKENIVSLKDPEDLYSEKTRGELE